MRTWSFISQKGGTGKSTLSTQLAVHATECGERALIVDLDPQGSAEVWHQKRGVDRHPGAMRCQPSNLAKVLEHARTFNITLILIDTAPHTDKDALVAMRASELIICPTQASLFDLKALEDTATLLDNANLKKKAAVVVNCIPPGSKTEAATYGEASAVVTSLGLRLCKKYVCYRRPFVSSTNEGRGVTEFSGAPFKAAADEIRGLWLELNQMSPAVTPRKSEVTK